jgi:hypothetical protein
MRIFVRLATVAPDEAMAIAAGPAKPSMEMRALLLSGSQQMRVLATLAMDSAHDVPTRRRVAPLASAIARGEISWNAAWKLSAGGPRYFSGVADLREAASGDEAAASISAELVRRTLTPMMVVHRGQSFHVEKTLGFVTPAARLVVLGSCRGVPEIHRVIEASDRAQVIATRGVGAMEINDSILKGLNTRLLSADGQIRWADFWREQQTRAGKSVLFREYLTPDRNEAAAFLRAYYQALDQ